MSAYNKKTHNSQQPIQNIQNLRNTKPLVTDAPAIPGTPLQQMWTVLNFHEHRLKQMAQYLQKLDGLNNASTQGGTTETEHMIQYNTLLQQVSELTDRVTELEATKESNNEQGISFSIEEDFKKASAGQPTV